MDTNSKVIPLRRRRLRALFLNIVKERGADHLLIALKLEAIDPVKSLSGKVRNISNGVLKTAYDTENKREMLLQIVVYLSSVWVGAYTTGNIPSMKESLGKAMGQAAGHAFALSRPKQFFSRFVIPFFTIKIAVCWLRLVIEELIDHPELTPADRESIEGFSQLINVFADGLSLGRSGKASVDKIFRRPEPSV